MKILISTSSIRQNIINELIKNNFIVKLNPYKRTLTTKEFIELTKDVDGIMAGTENITKEALRYPGRMHCCSCRIYCGINIKFN